MCVVLSFFHAFTGCNATSRFNGNGNKSCWETWDVGLFLCVTGGFACHMKNPFVLLTAEYRFFGLTEALRVSSIKDQQNKRKKERYQVGVSRCVLLDEAATSCGQLIKWWHLRGLCSTAFVPMHDELHKL